MNKSTYWQKLKDARWQKRRLEIMQRDNFVCRFCHDAGGLLHVHHFYYEKNKDPWDYPDDALITLCEDCHKSAEKMRMDVLKYITKIPALYAMHRISESVDMDDLSEYANACGALSSEYRISAAKSVIEQMNRILEKEKGILE